MTRLGDRPLRTAVVGGGPGGLFYASLAKRRFPAHEVVVHERNAPDATFGFGVVFSERTLSGFAAADPELHAEIERASVAWEDVEVRRAGRRTRCGGHGFSAISRKTLLSLLQQRAFDAGAELRFESETTLSAVADADVVVAADGVNSRVRDARQARFDPRFDVGAARYIWFATPQPFDALTFVFAEDEHGRWGAHAYPFEDGTSTFIVETDERTWQRAGLQETGERVPGTSDMATLRHCEQLFAEHLGGHGLLENNSHWLRFRTLRCASWHDGNVALIGDAAHTAHFSVGSGTKMAMEDAVALADAIGEGEQVGAALAAYEAGRRPAVDRIQSAATPSSVWWERFGRLADLPDERFAFHFLTRSPAVTRRRLQARDPRFVRAVDRWHAEATGAPAATGPLAAPLELGGLRVPSRLVVAADERADPLVALGGPAIAGAGLMLTRPRDGAVGAAAWVRANTPAVVGLALSEHATADDVRQAAADGFQVLAAPAITPVVDAWPADRPLLLMRPAPPDPEGPDGDEELAVLLWAARDRLLVVGVAPPPGAGSEGLATQLLFCDRVWQETRFPCTLAGGLPGADAAATAVLSGRAQLVLGSPSLVSDAWGA